MIEITCHKFTNLFLINLSQTFNIRSCLCTVLKLPNPQNFLIIQLFVQITLTTLFFSFLSSIFVKLHDIKFFILLISTFKGSLKHKRKVMYCKITLWTKEKHRKDNQFWIKLKFYVTLDSFFLSILYLVTKITI